MPASTDKSFVLGIYFGSSTLDGVLIQEGELSRKIVGQFSKAVSDTGSIEPSDVSALVPGMKSAGDDDYTLQVGGVTQEASSDLFLSSELERWVKGAEHASGSAAQSSSDRRVRRHFETQFREILSEASELAGGDLSLALCGSVPEFAYHTISKDIKTGSGGLLGSRSAEKTLLGELSTQLGQPVQSDRAGFLELGGAEGRQRFVGVVREQDDAILQTYRITQALHRGTLPAVAAVDSELSLVAGLIADSELCEGNNKTAVIRIGSEETLIVFFEGKQIVHFDTLRSINLFDAPETICSRVLLQQDEQKLGDLDHVLLLANSRAESLHSTFERYYPDAKVLHFERILADSGLELEEQQQPLRTGKSLAAGAALSIRLRTEPESSYINLLPRKLGARKKQKVQVGWHTLLMIPILFLVTFFFVVRYFSGEAEIEARHTELMMNPPAPPVTNPDVLQARVDSLELAYERHTRALYILDSLLIGSDKWSRYLETVTRATRDLSGVWLIRWNPQGLMVTFNGMALSRSRVSQFARRLDAVVESVSSLELSDADKTVRVYDFRIVSQVPYEMPEVARHLQTQPVGEPKGQGAP